MRRRRGHHVVGVIAVDPRPDLAFRQIAGREGGAVFAVGEGADVAVRHVQTKLGLALLGVEPVAGEALIGEDGADVAVELYVLRRVSGYRSGLGDGCQEESADCNGPGGGTS